MHSGDTVARVARVVPKEYRKHKVIAIPWFSRVESKKLPNPLGHILGLMT